MTSNAPLSLDVLARLSAWATAEFGLRFPPDRWSELARGVASAALELGISDLQGWAEALADGKLERDQVAAAGNHLTISETYFFRQRDTFLQLEKEILPERIRARLEQQRSLRIWSAGCASGEEPYSMGILLRRSFAWFPAERVTLIGTDLNTRSLEHAKRGVYNEWSFRDVPEWLKRDWFTRRGSRYELARGIRELVRFAPLNLASPHYAPEFGAKGDFDVILCRNVLMYLSAEQQEMVLRRLVDALARDGWLITGPCDVPATSAAELGLVSTHPGVLHRGRRIKAVEVPAWTLPPNVPVAFAPTPEVARTDSSAASPASATEPGTSSTAPVPHEDLAEVARRFADQGAIDEALRACDEALARDRAAGSLHHLRACILLEQDRLTEAAECYRRMLYLEPQSAIAEFALGCIAEREGRTADARHRFRNVIELLSNGQRGDAVLDGEGLTVARLQAMAEHNLAKPPP